MLDFWGFYDSYNTSKSDPEADAKALYSDWRTVGENLWEAYAQIRAEVAAEEAKQRERRVETETLA